MKTTEDMIKTFDDIAVRIGTLGYVGKSKEAELGAALQVTVKKGR
jgi:hypothetical protein